jgi:hypothetical protein
MLYVFAKDTFKGTRGVISFEPFTDGVTRIVMFQPISWVPEENMKDSNNTERTSSEDHFASICDNSTGF